MWPFKRGWPLNRGPLNRGSTVLQYILRLSIVIRGVQIRSDPISDRIRSDFGTEILYSFRIGSD